MALAEPEITLDLTPRKRLDLIDVTAQLRRTYGDVLSSYQRAVYYSYHTTAGYLEQSLCARLRYNRESLQDFIQSFQTLFPPGADYRHDELHLRSELTEEQRKCEPRNADSHLTFIGCGLANCVTYVHKPEVPVFFIDLDGICNQQQRRRQTTIIPFNRERLVTEVELSVPVSNHSVDSVNLKDPRLGLFQQFQEAIQRYEIRKGRIDLRLHPSESHAGLTVNEYETLLMTYDLVDVLLNPLHFMAEKGRHIWNDPRAVPSKALNYAKYDLVQVVNKFLNVMGLSESLLERIVNKFLAVPAERFLRMKRSVSLLVSSNEPGKSIVEGAYQSPIMVQWRRSENQTRRLLARLIRFE
ncbi:MAG TPA: hypothetical protein VKZ59_10895 [Acidobacteriota bacterium]|nr:hypothetical protein [Acidobacteriota bacterium]